MSGSLWWLVRVLADPRFDPHVVASGRWADRATRALLDRVVHEGIDAAGRPTGIRHHLVVGDARAITSIVVDASSDGAASLRSNASALDALARRCSFVAKGGSFSLGELLASAGGPPRASPAPSTFRPPAPTEADPSRWPPGTLFDGFEIRETLAVDDASVRVRATAVSTGADAILAIQRRQARPDELRCDPFTNLPYAIER